MPDGANTIPERPKPEAAAAADPLRELLSRLNRDAATVAAKDPDLSRAIGQLTEGGNRPGRTEDPVHRTKAAYALQDYEKLAGPISTVPAALRDEMTRLAATAPGLKNERLQELVKQTAGLSDKGLVNDIRDLALVTGKQGGDQSRAEVQGKVEALENRIRLSAAPAPVASPGQPAEPAGLRQPAPRADQVAPAVGAPATSPTPPGQPSGSPQPQRSPGADDPSPRRRPDWDNAKSPQVDPRQPQQEAAQSTQSGARGPGALALALGALASRWQANNTDGPDRPPTPIAERSARHEQHFQGQRDIGLVASAEKSQAAALSAVREFASGPASNILTKIQDAAKSDPGGMAAVLSEMREGGRFAGLRTQLNADLATERGAAAAYDKMSGALAQYGTDRAAVDALAARNPNAAALVGKFEKVDAEIGKAVSMLPSRSDGKSVMDDLGEKLKQVLDRAVEAVKSVFTPAADRGARTTSSPSPSP